jgi:RNA polymerase sigma factor (sigma-70 family)
MAAEQPDILLRHIRKLVVAHNNELLPDRELLGRFAAHHDEAAFETLVRRHGPMVLRVCRRVLGHVQDAEDVFQATFLVLVRQAASRHWHESVGNRLYGVAYRLAREAKRAMARRSKYESRAGHRSVSDPVTETSLREAQALLDEELIRLPEKYRAPLVICYLEGRTRDEAAKQLGWSLGTLKRRLEQGRGQLHDRLVRRGMSRSSALAAVELAQPNAPAAALVESALKAVVALASGKAKGVVSTQLIAWVEGMLKAMFLTKVKMATAVVLALVVATAGICLIAHQTLAAKAEPEKQPEEPRPVAHRAAEPKLEGDKQMRTDVYGDPLPPGALVRMGTVRLRHDHSGFLASDISPDGSVLATGGASSLRLWSMATGKLILQVKDNGEQYGSVIFSPDGKWLATAHSGSLCLLNAATGKLVQRIPGVDRVLAFSPDSKLVATSAHNPNGPASVSLWHATTGQRAFQLRGPVQYTYSAVFTSAGRTLVTMSASLQQGVDKIICYWDVATGTLLNTVALHLPPQRTSHTFRLSPDGQTVAVGPFGAAVSLWDTATGKERAKLQGDLAAARHLAFSRDGRILATVWIQPHVPEGILSFWDAATSKRLRGFPISGGANGSIHFAPDGRTLLMAGPGPQIRLWDTPTGRQRLQYTAHGEDITSLCFAPDGRTLISGAGDGTIRVWATANGSQERELAGHLWGVHSVTVLPDGQAVLSCGYNGVVRLQELHTGKELRRLVVVPQQEKLSDSLNHFHGLGLAVDGRTATSLSSRPNQPNALLQIWDLATGQPLVRRVSKSPIDFTAFSPDAKLMAVYVETVRQTKEGEVVPGTTTVIVEEVAIGRQVVALPQPEGDGYYKAFSPDSQTLATVTRRTIHLWELATGKERLTVTNDVPGYQFDYEQIAFAPDGRTLVTARGDHTLQLWDVATGQELLHRTGYEADVRALAFAPDGKTLATGHADSTILLWDLAAETWRRERSSRPLSAQELEAAWTHLASPDARKAHAAIWKLAAVPRQAIRLLHDRLRPAPAVPADRLRQLLKDLDSSKFREREVAAKQLAEFEEQAETALQNALISNPTAEQRQRIEAQLAGPRVVRSPEKLRSLRAIQVLEQSDLPEAQQVLQTLAQGDPAARLTQEAKASLQRLARRHAAMP